MAGAVDVIVPFSGDRASLAALIGRLAALALAEAGSIVVVDNTRHGTGTPPPLPARMRLLRASRQQSSYYARNRGADGSRADWLLFLDADVRAPADLVARYELERAGARTAVLAGAVEDAAFPGGRREPLASRYSRLRRLIDQQNTLSMRRPYAKTANCAIRRTAFEQVGGFAEGIRSGGDADLCFRLAQAGWELEARPGAVVQHESRASVRALLAQRARHGAGAQWLQERYPGFVEPAQSIPLLMRRICTGVLRAATSLGRGERDQALLRMLDPLSNAAYEAGRRLPNATGGSSRGR
jgi:hypothetical protein